MSKISVSVTDGTNVNLTVSPRPVQTITVSRGSTGTGTVTAVTANTPLSVTNGTTTPDLSIAQATTSTAGYISSTDWNTFNNKIGTITSSDNSITVTGTTTTDLVVNHTQNVYVYVRNATGATLTKGTVVYITGAIGQTPTISKAQANSDATSAQTLGVLTEDLANNTNGYITIIGLVTDVNTSAYSDGQQLYLSPTVAGGMTATKPQAPQHLVYVAIVEYAHAIHGKLFVKVQNGYELDELHDVQIISPTNGQTITYDAATNLWKNTTPAASGVTSVSGTGTVSGISLSGTVTSTGSLTLGGSLDLSAPPVIGNNTPNTITGTVITAKDGGASAFVIDDSNGTGVTCTFNIDQTTYNPKISATDGTNNYQLQLDTGLYIRNGSSILISNASNTSAISIKAPTSFTTYYLTLPTTTGSNNQVLKTDGTGVLSWTTVDPLTLTGISDPTAPTGTNTTVYSKSFGGYPTLAARNALNTSFGLQSALWSKNIQMWTTTAATAGSWLNASGTGNGTYTNVNPTTGGTLYQTVRRSTYANVITTTNQTLGIINGQASFFRGNAAGQGGYFFYARCGFDVWTNGGRFFAGMSQGATVVTANATGTNNTAGFAVEDTDAGAISFVTRSGTASTKTAVGLTITSNKGYDCYIYCSPNDTKITWQIIDINTGTSVTGTANTNLPVNTTMINPLVLASNAALTAATAISLGIAKIYVESDY